MQVSFRTEFFQVYQFPIEKIFFSFFFLFFSFFFFFIEKILYSKGRRNR